MTPDESLKQEALIWLNGKTNEQIADKIVETVNLTYDLTISRHKMRMKESLMNVLSQPVVKPNKAWWSFW